MNKHLIDGNRARAGARLRRYIAIERAHSEGIHPIILQMLRNSKGRYSPGLRTVAYARVERGIRA